MEMTKKERIMTAVRGGKPDKTPYSLWSHMPQFDHDADQITDQTLAFYEKYDLDFIKTMNNGMYSIEDFGVEIDYSTVAQGGKAELVSTPVHTAADWLNLSRPSIQEGALGRELHYLQMLKRRLGEDDVPVIFTVFSPISTVNKLCGGNAATYIHDGHGNEIKAALELITEVTCDLAKEAIHLGADGIFLAAQMSNYTNEMATEPLKENEYEEFGKPYDIRVLEAARSAGGWMNTLHCHGTDIMFNILKDYPVDVFNWHVWETYPTLDETLEFTGKCLMGGLKRFDITHCQFNAIHHQIYKCLKITGGKNLILTPGCVIRYPLNEEMLHYVRKTLEEEERILKITS
ncbi:uroporphyrinogen decarboxylase [[Clostridium] aminophilum]|uniref:Uroporphyrinogen decarboxylase n=1 Tax=[Clostridium] aminophilum TaxID=1526 RepID=A0A1I0CG26_9FIRM|nr:uroporphyrinogen decarboxylase family protein [[Clostridium] aminophilum]SET18546.1 uroporphyrinogen decarboxylase [[Clostridium] aminophilum]